VDDNSVTLLAVIALCAVAPQQMPAKEEILQIVNGTVESIVRAAGDVPAAE
jgi:hypothetical protein